MCVQVVKRGARPLGGGEVVLRVPVMKQLPLINLTDEGVRGEGGVGQGAVLAGVPSVGGREGSGAAWWRSVVQGTHTEGAYA